MDNALVANGNLKSLLLTSTLLAPVGYNPSNDSTSNREKNMPSLFPQKAWDESGIFTDPWMVDFYGKCRWMCHTMFFLEKQKSTERWLKSCSYTLEGQRLESIRMIVPSSPKENLLICFPIASMVWTVYFPIHERLIFMVNVGEYTIRGCYVFFEKQKKHWNPGPLYFEDVKVGNCTKCFVAGFLPCVTGTKRQGNHFWCFLLLWERNQHHVFNIFLQHIIPNIIPPSISMNLT